MPRGHFRKPSELSLDFSSDLLSILLFYTEYSFRNQFHSLTWNKCNILIGFIMNEEESNHLVQTPK